MRQISSIEGCYKNITQWWAKNSSKIIPSPPEILIGRHSHLCLDQASPTMFEELLDSNWQVLSQDIFRLSRLTRSVSCEPPKRSRNYQKYTNDIMHMILVCIYYIYYYNHACFKTGRPSKQPDFLCRLVWCMRHLRNPRSSAVGHHLLKSGNSQSAWVYSGLGLIWVDEI